MGPLSLKREVQLCDGPAITAMTPGRIETDLPLGSGWWDTVTLAAPLQLLEKFLCMTADLHCCLCANVRFNLFPVPRITATENSRTS